MQMNDREGLDIFQRRSRNRKCLAVTLTVCFLITMVVSASCLYLLSRTAHLNLNFWLLLAFFWLTVLIFTTLRYAVSGSRYFKNMAVLPPWKTTAAWKTRLTRPDWPRV